MNESTNEIRINNLEFENTALKKVLLELIDLHDIQSIHALVIKFGITYDNYLSLLHFLGTYQKAPTIQEVTTFLNQEDPIEMLTDNDTTRILKALQADDIMVEQIEPIWPK